jgi:serine/threonine-protein kinase RsbW
MSPLATVHVEHQDGVSLARITGEIDTSNIREVGQALESAALTGAGLIIDFSAVTYLNSATVKFLFDLAEQMRTREQQLRLVLEDTAPMRRLLLMLKLDLVVPVHNGIADALTQMRGAEQAEEDVWGRTQTRAAGETIDVTIPAKAEYVSIARLAAAAMAARQAFTFDEIEDLKIAVSEACNVLIASARGRRRPPITLHLAPERDALAVLIEAQGVRLELDPRVPDAHRPLDESTLGIFLMQCLVDEVGIRPKNGSGSTILRLVKRRQEKRDASPPPAEQD